VQELQPNTVYNYGWLLGLIYPYVGRVRASRLSARMTERAYRQLEAAGYSRTTLRTLNLVLTKAFGEQTGRTLGAHQPRETDVVRPVWTLAEARRFLSYVVNDRLYPLWRLLLTTGLRRGELCGLMWRDLEPDLATLTVRRQRVVEDPTSRVREKPPKSHNGTRSLLLDPVTLTILTDIRPRARAALVSGYMCSPAAVVSHCDRTLSAAASTSSLPRPAYARSAHTKSGTCSPPPCSTPATASPRRPNASATTPPH
jgi:integrase